MSGDRLRERADIVSSLQFRDHLLIDIFVATTIGYACPLTVLQAIGDLVNDSVVKFAVDHSYFPLVFVPATTERVLVFDANLTTVSRLRLVSP
jgi:hypothetical protein